MYGWLLASPFDVDFDGHVGLSDLILIAVAITALAAAYKVVKRIVIYVREAQRQRFANSVVKAIQPQLTRIYKVEEQVIFIREMQREILRKLEVVNTTTKSVEAKTDSIDRKTN